MSDAQSFYEEKKAKVKPYVVPGTMVALALSAAYFWGKTKSQTLVVTTHNANGDSSTEVGRI